MVKAGWFQKPLQDKVLFLAVENEWLKMQESMNRFVQVCQELKTISAMKNLGTIHSICDVLQFASERWHNSITNAIFWLQYKLPGLLENVALVCSEVNLCHFRFTVSGNTGVFYYISSVFPSPLYLLLFSPPLWSQVTDKNKLRIIVSHVYYAQWA